MLDARAVALQGIGFRPLTVAVQGFAIEIPLQRGVAGGGPIGSMAQSPSTRKRRRPLSPEYSSAEEFDKQVALLQQIEREDEIAIALVMAAMPLIGENKWRH